MGSAVGVAGDGAGAGGGAAPGPAPPKPEAAPAWAWAGGGTGWPGVGGAAWAIATLSTAAQLANAPSQMQRARINWNRFMEFDSSCGASGQKAPAAPPYVRGAIPHRWN